MALSKLLTTAQVARKYGLSQKRILQIIRAGHIRAWKSDGKFVIPEEYLPETPSWPTKPGPKAKTRKGLTKLNQNGPRGIKGELLCESCMVSNQMVPATTRCQNPDYAGYNLCEQCAKEHDDLRSTSIRPSKPKPSLSCAICQKPVESGHDFCDQCLIDAPETDI